VSHPYYKKCYAFATGPRGDAGNTGGTGATGQMYTVESTPRPTLYPPCLAPKGEDACTISDVVTSTMKQRDCSFCSLAGLEEKIGLISIDFCSTSKEKQVGPNSESVLDLNSCYTMLYYDTQPQTCLATAYVSWFKLERGQRGADHS